MSDTWSTPIKDWATGAVLAESDLDTEIRDRTDVLSRAVDGDASATTIKHRHLTGTLAARPAAGEAGRFYFATDINSAFLDDGTRWRIIQAGAYDGFTRGDSTTITPADSGHAWTEQAGDLEIASNALQVVSAAASSIATVDIGGLLDGIGLQFMANIRTASTLADVNSQILPRFVDTSNYLMVGIIGSGTANLRIAKNVAGTPTTLASVTLTLSTSTTYILRVMVHGPVVEAELWQDEVAAGSGIRSVGWRTPGDTLDAGFSAATKCGLRISNDVADRWGFFSVAAH